MPDRRQLEMWTIYWSPLDQPGLFVARKFLIDVDVTPTRVMFTAETLEELRSLLPRGLVCLYREPGDDPEIVESWI